jgi:hypothetical protein
MNTVSKKVLIKRHCKNKVAHPTAYHAWTDAMYQTIVHGTFMAAYKCGLGCEKYHLSSKHQVGDGSHIPPEYRDFFQLYAE